MMPELTPDLAARLASIALDGVTRAYPYSPGHVLMDATDIRHPRSLHPAFYGCFDWHSAVHSHWLLLRLLQQQPDLAQADRIRRTLNMHLTVENLQIEAAYFREPGRRNFERPYGWAWLLKLAAELHTWDDRDGARWSAAIQPLAEQIVELYLRFLPRLTYPIRSGVHSNTAFGLILGLDYAATIGDEPLRRLIISRAKDYYVNDKHCPASWEPSGGDFFSPCLIEADLMRRVLAPAAFSDWLAAFLPELAQGAPPELLNPAQVSDRSDGQIVHLDGLNLSRAWCMWGIAGILTSADQRRAVLLESATRHAIAGMSGVGSGDYMGDHWLGSFALYMLGCARHT